jgi:molybdopterin-biosynthesis enzyme MoeA-like protein
VGSNRPRAAVVVTGSELLTGVIPDRNGPWVAGELTALGFEVAHVHNVGRDQRAFIEAYRAHVLPALRSAGVLDS